jgi:peptidoglycan/xylan/chitin deacetylase (PgdA/CDA1 family)
VALKDKNNGKVSQAGIIISGIIIVLGAILIYLYVLQGVFGRFDAKELIPDASAIKNIFTGKGPTAAILYSGYTKNILPEGSTWLDDNISTWKKFLGDNSISYDVITDASVETGKLKDYKMLILPGSKSLSDKEIVAIKKFLQSGGSVFATSGTASFSNDGKWRGWDFLNNVFGINFTGEISNSNKTSTHTLRGGLPLTANIPTGFSLQIATWDRPMAVEVLDPRTIQVSFWYNYKTEGGLVRQQIKKTAGIVYGNYGKGRFVWMGFEINSVIGVHDDYVYFDRLFRNCCSWLTYIPIAYTQNWPSGYAAAAVITPALSGEIDNITNLFNYLKSENVEATFFVDPDKAEYNPRLINSLTNYGEVSVIADVGYLSSAADTNNTLYDYLTQYKILYTSKQKLESITGTRINGCNPFYGLFDQNTVKAAIEAGYTYLLTDSLTDRSVPRTVIRGDKRLVVMTKTARDDYEVIRDFGLSDPEFQFYTYQEDIDRILFEGGMYIYKIHTEYQCKPQNVSVVNDVIKDLKKKNFWITTASEIQKWYSKKDYVELRVTRRGDTRIALNISNPGEQDINDLVVDVLLNDEAENISISTEIIGTQLPIVEHDKQSKHLRLIINNLKGKESRIYYIDYDRVNV